MLFEWLVHDVEWEASPRAVGEIEMVLVVSRSQDFLALVSGQRVFAVSGVATDHARSEVEVAERTPQRSLGRVRAIFTMKTCLEH
jgi:hypothetical protein